MTEDGPPSAKPHYRVWLTTQTAEMEQRRLAREIEEAEASAFMLQNMLGDRRLPTVPQCMALKQRFSVLGLDRARAYEIREMLACASLIYHEAIQPAPNEAAKQLRKVHQSATALLAALYSDDAAARAVTGPVAPYMMREKLEQLIRNTQRDIEHVTPLATPGQRRRKGYGLRSMIVHLSCNVICLTERETHPTYTQGNPCRGTHEFSGVFVEFTETVCRLCGIAVSNQTLGGAIKELVSAGRIPWNRERDANPSLWD